MTQTVHSAPTRSPETRRHDERRHDERRPGVLAGTWWSPALVAAVVLSGVGVLVAGAGLVLDPTRITGAVAWLKPLKFAVSIAVYCATMIWLLRFLRSRRRAAVWLARVTAGSLLVELVLIDLQVARGQASHFNTATTLDAVVYQLMGVFAVAAFLAAAVTGVLLLRERDLPQPLGTGIRAALLVTVLGMAEAFAMILHGAHTVGGPDGGPGLPMTGWSSQHGDLRVAHFVGLHALQVLLVATWLLMTYAPRLARRCGRQLVRTAAAAYAGVVLVVTWQAERSQPVTRPDVGTLAVTGLLLATCTCVAMVQVVRSRPTTGRDEP